MAIVLDKSFLTVWLVVSVIIYILWQLIIYVAINRILKIYYNPWQFIVDLLFEGERLLIFPVL